MRSVDPCAGRHNHMFDYGFIGHYLRLQQVGDSGPFGRVLKHLPRGLRKRAVPLIPARVTMRFDDVRSKCGTSVSGAGIMCSLLPEHFVARNESEVLRRVNMCIKLAARQGVKIVSLGGFTSIIGNQGENLQEVSPIPLTTGNTYAAGLIIKSVLAAMRLLGIEPKRTRLAIIGASGDIGVGCLRVFERYFREINLVARDRKRLEKVARDVGSNGCHLRVGSEITEAVSRSEVVVTVASALTTIVDPSVLLPGAIVCDAALPHNMSRELAQRRDDILVYDGGIAELWYPYVKDEENWKRTFDTLGIVGCLAEAMILALEGRYESYSLGRWHITPERIEQIWAWGEKHGFTTARFQIGGKGYSEAHLERLRKIILARGGAS